MKVLLSWIREFVDVDEPAEAIGARLTLRGLALDGIEPRPTLPAPPWAVRSRPAGDAVLDVDVTANRPDCLSIAGIAREIAAVYRLPFRGPADPTPGAAGDVRSMPDSFEVDAGQDATTAAAGGGPTPAATPPRPSQYAPAPAYGLPISITDPDLCARYVGGLADVVVGPSPAWMAERLEACGVRPINNVVDITNYVLLELGHPMHAFDHARLAGPAIIVRRARRGESLRTLDGRTRTLTPEMLVIADAERATAVGGVMGGADSEVSDATRRIVFEAAWFLPQSVRATSKALGLKTEASTRFERGADPTAPTRAVARAFELLVQIEAGRPLGPAIDAYPRPFHARTLLLAHPRVAGLLGMDVPNAEAVAILTSLGFGVTRAPGGWSVTVPPWRVDMHRDVDLVEEIGRHHGFEHLPATFPPVEQAPPPSDPRIARDARARAVALARGFSESICFAFIEARHAEPFAVNGVPVTLANPLSEKFTVMRPSLVPGLVESVGHNRRHGRRDVQLFEIGTRFSPAGEVRSIGFAWTGLATPDHWSGGRRLVDFFDLKGVVEELAAGFGASLDARPPAAGSMADAVLVPGGAATLWSGGQALGWLGQLRPAIGEAHHAPAADPVFVAEIDLDRLSGAASDRAALARPLPRFPAVVRDIAILIDEALSAERVRGTIRAAGPETLVSCVEFDRYQGAGIPAGKVSLALRLTFQSPKRTLTDAEVQEGAERILAAVQAELGAVQR
jgi:phenylalanyl-tRNA synthetase beta chain